jgi:hypothetical protein
MPLTPANRFLGASNEWILLLRLGREQLSGRELRGGYWIALLSHLQHPEAKF